LQVGRQELDGHELMVALPRDVDRFPARPRSISKRAATCAMTADGASPETTKFAVAARVQPVSAPSTAAAPSVEARRTANSPSIE
jgi:hypothetical protein